MGKIIVIEGTDCSGKQTQAKMLCDWLNAMGHHTESFSYPNYDSPTGKIIAGPYLAKPETRVECYFPEGPDAVDPKVSGLLYAADRLYNAGVVEEMLSRGDVILDRYVDSNMAHQGGKIASTRERYRMYKWFEALEYKLLGLPKPDIRILLYMPHEFSKKLRDARGSLDLNESCEEHIIHAEQAYLEIASRNHYHVIDCVRDNKILSVDEIFEQIKKVVGKGLGVDIDK